MTRSIVILISAVLLAGCVNGAKPKSRNSSQSVEKITAPKVNYRISSVDFAVPRTEGDPLDVTVRLDTTPPFTNLTEYCTTEGGIAPCSCYFKWTEVNPNSVYTVTIPRYVETALTLIQPGLAQCKSPDKWEVDVRDGTTVQVGIKPSQGDDSRNPELAFAMPAFSVVKGPPTSGEFTDNLGRQFDNILHYSCYEQFPKGMSIKSRRTSIQVGGGGATISAMFANDFCVRNVEAGGAVPQGCEGPDTVDFSAEANYYNLYTRAADRGTINGSSNGRYTCPTVENPLSGNPNPTFWPLDTNFALAISPNPDFPVAVEGFTKLSYGSDPKSQPTTCYSSGTASGPAGDTILTGCLGFGAKPRPDGSCGTFRDASGVTKPMFRLRRYITIYPPAFEADGRPYNQGQPSDVVYVLDRPVTNPNGDPLRPFTMLGPKPCPFAYFDHKSAARPRSAIPPTYVGTSNAAWSGKNYDGLQFPNRDDQNSCSAFVAIPNATRTRVSFGTINERSPITSRGPNVTPLNQVFIRPTRPWAPHYEEDTSFLACAPQSTPVKDPPLHFAKQPDGNVAWCAEVYPSQNGNVERLDTIAGAANTIVPWTSHTVKGTAGAAAASCVGRAPATLPGGYTGPARHVDAINRTAIGLDGPSNATCDRTIPASLDAFYRIPLLSPPADTESAIAQDPSYACTITYDGGGAKRGRLSPTQGCCGASVLVQTATAAPSSAHLEPTGDSSTPTGCLTPTY
jgi:hypothetical protein